MKYDKKIIVIVIAIAIVLVAITKCTYGIIEDAKINLYNINNATIGIDVSEHQGEINWWKVRRDNIKFAFVRVGYRAAKTGIMNEDKYYKENIEGALKEGIPVGVYFFSQATTTEEATTTVEATTTEATTTEATTTEATTTEATTTEATTTTDAE